MPEGDTIFRAARTLHAALAGKKVTRFETMFPKLARVDDESPIAGRTIESVRAQGKHLLMDFSGGLHLRTHMRMNGSWHIYRQGERWQRPRSDVRVVIETSDFVAVAFNVPVAEFLDDRALERSRELRRLGPDVLAEDFDADEAFRRIRARADRVVDEVLLDQHAIAGIGNIWKSEVLFACRVHPFLRVEQLTDDEVRCLIDRARKLLARSANAIDGRNDLNVYSRGGQPCRRCRTKIESRKRGLDARLTYWCPQCQRAVG
ncbi:MAG TPA: DNA-formamidopyrimidine glycosylase family protein [Thermoanaerobaculia bacterium]|nr:DNA-formamidopyrimidine glycosylase family protein [Thermoanaerobaculia bacterium]